MIRLAGELAGVSQVTPELRVMDVMDLKFADASFDLVLACGMSKKTRTAAVMLAMLILPVLLVFNLLPNTDSGPVLTHFNTRAGSAALLEIPSVKKTFLLDACGGSPAANQRLLHSILKAGHRRIDGVFLTHPHADHAGALPLLTESLEVGEVFCSSHFGLNKKGRENDDNTTVEKKTFGQARRKWQALP